MNRLQKKCVIVTVGLHLLLLTLLFVGPAFFSPRPNADDIRILDVIPANLIDAPFNSGVANAAPPPPEPAAPPPRPAPVVPPPPEPEKAESPKPVVKETEKAPKPVVKPSEPRKPQVSTKLVTRNASKSSSRTATASAARTRAFQSALKRLRGGLSSGTVVDAPGTGSVAYGSYKDALGSIYYDAWVPEGGGDDEANTYARITVAADGTVIDARIITPSGDERTDNSIRRALQRVSEVPPLPDQSKVQQEFTIVFNLKAKRMLE
jgi:protein TonB